MLGVLAAHDLLPSEERDDEPVDDELVVDEFDGAPEEANADDPDEPPELEEPLTAARYRSPDITFALVPLPPRRPDPQTAQVVRTRRRPETLTWSTRPVVDELVSSIPDHEGADLWEERLDRLAATLAGHQHTAITATDASNAYQAILPMTAKQLAGLADLEVTWLSRSRTLIVQCLWGPAPLEMFWWKSLGADGLDIELCALYRELRKDPRRNDSATATAAAKAVLPRASQAVTAKRAGALRKHLPVLRRIYDHRHHIAAYRRAFPYISVAEIAEILNLPAKSRGESALRLAVLGVLDEGAT